MKPFREWIKDKYGLRERKEDLPSPLPSPPPPPKRRTGPEKNAVLAKQLQNRNKNKNKVHVAKNAAEIKKIWQGNPFEKQ